jgi:hypothetical protein
MKDEPWLAIDHNFGVNVKLDGTYERVNQRLHPGGKTNQHVVTER